jgi:hypothetical protein
MLQHVQFNLCRQLIIDAYAVLAAIIAGMSYLKRI